MNVEVKRNRLAEIQSDMQAILQSAENEQRTLTQDEKDKFDALEKEANELIEQVEQYERMQKTLQNVSARANVQHVNSEEKELQKIANRYSIVKLIRALRDGQKVTGVEAEVHQEMQKRAAAAGVDTRGVLVPANLRAITVSPSTAGGVNVQTDVQDIVPVLQPDPIVARLGANVLTNLVGNLSFPRNTSVTDPSWKGETVTADEVEYTFDSVDLIPKRLPAYVQISNQMLVQTSNDVEAYVRRVLNTKIAAKIDAAVINGSGTGEPLGILNTSGIATVAIGTNGGAPEYKHIVALEAAIEEANAMLDNVAYLTTPGVKAKLKVTSVDAGSGQFVWANGELNGYRAAASTLVPSNLTKGTGTGLHAILFGDWSQVVYGQWGGFSIIVDPYTDSKSGMTNIVVETFADAALVQPGSFAAIVDADATI